MNPGTRSNDPYLLALLALSLTANVLMASGISWPSKSGANALQVNGAGPTALVEGTAMPAVTGKTTSGQSTKIEFGSDTRPTLLYAFTTACPWCKRNVPNINAIASTRAGAFRVVGIALETDPAEVQGYVQTYGLQLNTIVLADPATRVAYRLGSVPETILLTADGRITKTWTGAYSGKTANEVAAALTIKLPGLLPAEAIH